MGTVESQGSVNPNNGSQNPSSNKEIPKVVIVMGATGAGKSRLAIDLASHFPVEIINADSMQVYKGLDILTNKVPLSDQQGVPHHLLGTFSPKVEFTAKDFRDSAIPIIDDILSRNRLPVIVGGTNYYIQALVSPYLLDDSMEDMDDNCLDSFAGENQLADKDECGNVGFGISYDRLKELDPDSANRIHPNDHRKINQYLNMYARSGVLPSKLFRGKASEKWGRVDNSRYDCCFICVDGSLPLLDQYVNQRVDCMINGGLLNEVFDIYNENADYTRGIRQAIGVREFEDFLRSYTSNMNQEKDPGSSCLRFNDKDNDSSTTTDCKVKRENWRGIMESSNSQLKVQLNEAIDELKANTRRLVRRQRRRVNRLQTVFGWDVHFVDVTEALIGNSNDSWRTQVVEPSVNMIKSFLSKSINSMPDSDTQNDNKVQQRLNPRDLWTQYVCEACGHRVLRGAHEWEQHKLGRGHRKRILHLKKKSQFLLAKEAATGAAPAQTQALDISLLE